MNQNQTESKPPNVEEPREEKLDETTYSRSDSEHPSLVAKLKDALALADALIQAAKTPPTP